MVEAVHVPDADELASDMIAGMGEFVEAQPPEPTPQTPRADAPPLASREPDDPEMGALPPAPDGTLVVLTNLEFIHECVMLPMTTASGRQKYSGTSVQFRDGHLITDPATAAVVQAACPYVYEEPKSGPIFGPHAQTGFQTRDAKGWERYNYLLGLNR